SINDHIDKLTEINNAGLEVSETLNEKVKIVENLTTHIKSIESSSIDSLKKQIEDLTGLFIKNANKVIGNYINLSKDSKSFLSDLKAAIILLESTKNPIKNKLDTLEIENKTLQKSITDLKNQNEELLRKVENYEKGGE
ncbi:MAG: hypothetical protein ACFE9M_09660, partial [Promethearchaeota archaeon]